MFDETTHFSRLEALAEVLAALDDASFSSPEDRASQFETLLSLKGYAVVQNIPAFPGRAIR